MTRDQLENPVAAGGARDTRESDDDTLDVLRRLYQTAPVGQALFDRELRCILINDRLAELHGRSVGEYIGKTISEAIPEMARQMEPLFRTVINTHKSAIGVELSDWMGSETGTERFYRVNLYPLDAKDGALRWIHVVVRDITEQKRAAVDLEERLKFEELLSGISTAFIHLPAEMIDKEITTWLERLADFLGVETTAIAQFTEDGTGLHITHVHALPGTPQIPPRLDSLQWYTATLRRGETVVLARLPDDLPPEAAVGKELARRLGMKSHISIPLAVGKTVLGTLGVVSFHRTRAWPDDLVRRLRLVGEVFANALMRKRTDQSLRESEERFRKVFEEGPLGMALVGTDLRINHVNRRICEMLGYSEAELKRFSIRSLVHPDDVDREVALVRELFAGRLPFYQIEERLIKKDASHLWVRLTATVLRDENGEVLCGLGMLEDVTQRKRAQDDAHWLRQELAQASRVATLGELAAALAHELNQPLAAILSNAQTAQCLLAGESPDLDEVRDTLTDIEHDDHRAGEVIKRLRALLKTGDLRREAVHVNDVVRQVVKLIHAEVVSKKIAVGLELAGDLPSVAGDRIQLQQVILNLLMNAVEAMSDEEVTTRELVIRTRKDAAGTVIVAVRDSGVGLDDQNEDRIFDSFFTTKPQGMGMGLSISRSIVEAHDGLLWVTKNPGRGTTFSFSLPSANGVQDE